MTQTVQCTYPFSVIKEGIEITVPVASAYKVIAAEIGRKLHIPLKLIRDGNPLPANFQLAADCVRLSFCIVPQSCHEHCAPEV